jgi:hypothetical protein
MENTAAISQKQNKTKKIAWKICNPSKRLCISGLGVDIGKNIWISVLQI